MGGVLRGVSSFGEGFEKTFSKYTERKAAIEQEQLRAERDHQWGLDLETMKNVFTEGQNKLDRDLKVLQEGTVEGGREHELTRYGSWEQQKTFNEFMKGSFDANNAFTAKLNGFFSDKERLEKFRISQDHQSRIDTQGYWKDRVGAETALAKLNNNQALTLADRRHLHTMAQIQSTAQFQESTSLLLQGEKFNSDVYLATLGQNFDMERMYAKHKNDESIINLTEGLRSEEAKKSAFRSFYYTRMLEQFQEKFKDVQGDKEFQRQAALVQLRGGEERKTLGHSLSFQHMLKNTPDMAVMLMIAKRHDLPLRRNPATDMMEIDFEDALQQPGGKERVDAFSSEFQEGIRSNLGQMLSKGVVGLDPVNNPEDQATMAATQAVFGNILSGTPEEAAKGLEDLKKQVPRTPGEIMKSPLPYSQDTEVGAAVKAQLDRSRRRRVDREFWSVTRGGVEADTTIGDILQRSDVSSFDRTTLNISALEHHPTASIWKVGERVNGLLVFNTDAGTDIAEEADKRVDTGEPAGLLSFDPVKGAPFVLPRSAEVFPDGWDYSEKQRNQQVELLDEICREDVDQVTALFSPDIRAYAGGDRVHSKHALRIGPSEAYRPAKTTTDMWSGAQRKVPAVSPWNKGRSNAHRKRRMKEIGINRLTPRTFESTRAAMILWVANEDMYQAYLREIGNKRFDNTGKLTERADPNSLPPTLPTPRPITQDPGSWGFGNVGLNAGLGGDRGGGGNFPPLGGDFGLSGDR